MRSRIDFSHGSTGPALIEWLLKDISTIVIRIRIQLNELGSTLLKLMVSVTMSGKFWSHQYSLGYWNCSAPVCAALVPDTMLLTFEARRYTSRQEFTLTWLETGSDLFVPNCLKTCNNVWHQWTKMHSGSSSPVACFMIFIILEKIPTCRCTWHEKHLLILTNIWNYVKLLENHL